MGTLDDLTDLENSLLWLTIALKRIDWAAEHFHEFQSFPEWHDMESHATSANVKNEAGANLYAFFVTRGLKTAIETASMALRSWNGPDGFIPCEILLRSALIGASKALYLLAPDEDSARERRTKLVYQSDRNAQDYAFQKDQKLRGIKVDPKPKPPSGVDDSKIIRDAIDGFVSNGNCQCGRPDCPQEDLESLRHRLLQTWWIYSSVSHVNLWHIESAPGLSLDGERVPAGNFGTMAADVCWVICKAVETLFRRYGRDKAIQPLDINFGEIAESLRH